MKKPATDPKTAVAYLRWSTSGQDLTPAAQRAAIDAWAAREGVLVAAWHEDAATSGGDAIEDCPGLLAAIDALPAYGAAVLVVAKRDRLARDTLKAAMLEALVKRNGAAIISTAGEGNGDDPVQLLMRRVVDAFSEYERLLIGSRTKAALHVKIKKGERCGAIPIGYRLDENGPRNAETGRLVRICPDEGEQATIAAARQLRSTGLSLRAIAAELIARGFKPRVGATFGAETVKRMCDNARMESV